MTYKKKIRYWYFFIKPPLLFAGDKGSFDNLKVWKNFASEKLTIITLSNKTGVLVIEAYIKDKR